MQSEADPTRREFIAKLARASVFAPPTMASLALQGRPCPQGDRYQRRADFYRRMAERFERLGIQWLADYYYGEADRYQAMADAEYARCNGLSDMSSTRSSAPPPGPPSVPGSSSSRSAPSPRGGSGGRTPPGRGRGLGPDAPWSRPPP